jgi:glucosylceramidase
MDLRDPEEARLAVAVGHKLRGAGLHTKILGYDHNWSLHPKRRRSAR